MPLFHSTLSLVLVGVSFGFVSQAEAALEKSSLKVLFIGNSYTARHNLADVVEAMAEAGHPGLDFQTTQVIYGGRRLIDHWRLGSANFLRLTELSEEEQSDTIQSLEAAVAADEKDKYAKSALARHRQLLKDLEKSRTRFDLVVLQSYRDDLDGDDSLYAQYAPKFVEIAKAQGARVVLYETTPTTQNAEPLKATPPKAPILEKARSIARLANRLDVDVAPMSLVAHRCQTERPDLTLRFVNDAHLNQTLAYLTACTLYAAIFETSPEGLAVDSVTDIRFWQREDGTYDRTKDRDNQPITRVFEESNRTQLQKFAWNGYCNFQMLRNAAE